MFKRALLGVAVGSVRITKGLGGRGGRFTPGLLGLLWLTTGFLQSSYAFTASTGFLQVHCGVTIGSL